MHPSHDPVHLHTYVTLLEPEVFRALERGADEYGDLWIDMMQPTHARRAHHLIDIHARAELARAVQAIDYGDHVVAVQHMASAVGYLAVLVSELQVPEHEEPARCVECGHTVLQRIPGRDPLCRRHELQAQLKPADIDPCDGDCRHCDKEQCHGRLWRRESE